MGHGKGRRRHGQRLRAAAAIGIAGLIAACPAATSARGLSHFEFSLGVDYRLGEFDWNIAGDANGANPNILSELSWVDLEIPQVTASMSAHFGDHVVLRADGAYGRIINGKNQDSDYAGDNRTLEFSRSNNAGRGDTDDTSLALGYRFVVFDEAAGRYAHITPLAGYSLHHQNLKIKNGVQTIPATEPLPGLNSTYDAEWQGPWLGVNMRLEADERTALLVDLAYHWADYAAEANWNLRDDLAHPVSYRHDSQGQGVIAALGITHVLRRHWAVLVRLESQHWSADPGTDIVYLVDATTGAPQPPSTTRLNAVHWVTRALGAAVIFRY